MSCHICIYWTPENGCNHYGPEKKQPSFTHKTKKGFGGLLAAGIECYIHSKVKGGVFICLKGRGNLSGQPPMFWGKMKDLEIIN